MDENPENLNVPDEPLFTDTPAVEPIPEPSPAYPAAEEWVASAAEEVIDVTPTAVEGTSTAAEEPAWATVGTTPEVGHTGGTAVETGNLEQPCADAAQKEQQWLGHCVSRLVGAVLLLCRVPGTGTVPVKCVLLDFRWTVSDNYRYPEQHLQRHNPILLDCEFYRAKNWQSRFLARYKYSLSLLKMHF